MPISEDEVIASLDRHFFELGIPHISLDQFHAHKQSGTCVACARAELDEKENTYTAEQEHVHG